MRCACREKFVVDTMRALASDTRMLPLRALALLILASTASALVTGLTLPGGFAVDTYYAGRVPHVRSLALSGATPQAGYGPIVYGADREDGKVGDMEGTR